MKCKSPGCYNDTRMRSFKGSYKQHPEDKCGVCMSTNRRYGLTGPERDKYVADGGKLKELTVDRDPS